MDSFQICSATKQKLKESMKDVEIKLIEINQRIPFTFCNFIML